jgi:hypothetical protein
MCEARLDCGQGNDKIAENAEPHATAIPRLMMISRTSRLIESSRVTRRQEDSSALAILTSVTVTDVKTEAWA